MAAVSKVFPSPVALKSRTLKVAAHSGRARDKNRAVVFMERAQDALKHPAGKPGISAKRVEKIALARNRHCRQPPVFPPEPDARIGAGGLFGRREDADGRPLRVNEDGDAPHFRHVKRTSDDFPAKFLGL